MEITTLDIINGLPALDITIYASQPFPKEEGYGWVSISSSGPSTYTTSGFMFKQIRLSISIVAPIPEKCETSEEVFINDYISQITNAIADEGSTKIVKRGNVSTLFCKEDFTTPLFTTGNDRVYKVRDFLIGYYK